MKLLIPFLFIASALPLLAKGDLDARYVTVNDTSPDPGDTVTVRWEAINRTDDYIGGSQQGVMWSSDDSTIERSDTLLEKEYVGPLGGTFYSDRTNETRVVKIPSNATRGRTYYIGVYADYDRQRDESDETNNNSGAVAVTIRPTDLYATDLSINDGSPDLGDLVTVEWTAKTRQDTYVSSSEQGVMLSTDDVIDKSDTFLEYEGLGPLGGNALPDSTLELRTITIPTNLTPGETYYLGVIMDYDNDISESTYGTNYENNNNYLAGAFTPRCPDLEATDLEANTLIFTEKSTSISTWPGDSINLEWVARNSGNGSTLINIFNGGTEQAVRWSTDPTVDRNDRILEREYLGPLSAGDTSPELRTIEIPSDVVIGETYYIAVESDVDRESPESDESNNFSNVIEVTIISPISSSSFNLGDFNYLPDLEGEGLEADDPRLRDNTGDGQEDPGVTINPSRCFAPGDRAYLQLDANLSLAYTSDFNPVADIRLTGWWNTTRSLTGATKIGPQVVTTSLIGELLNMGWDPPTTPGEYYVYFKAEVKVEGVWYEFDSAWLDGGAPIVVSDALPIILIHGWSDDKGKTFGNLELLIETLWQRPVRSFGYETDNTVDILLGTGTGDGPRVDQGHTEIVNGETKESLAVQLKTFLASPENDSTEIERCDIIAHSMGGLVARNYILSEDKVRRLVTIGTPSYGGLFSAEAGALLNNQAEDLEFGAPVTWKLYREWSEAANRSDLPRCLAIVGTNDFAPGQFNQSDVVVPCSSVSLESLGFPIYYVPLGHSGAFREPGWTDPETGAEAIAVIEDEIHPSFPALESFLNSEDCSLPDNLPGHNGGSNDVGDKEHPEALPNGAIYIVSVDNGGEPETITSVNFGHTPSLLPISSNGIQQDSGIFFANLVDANNSSSGQRFYTEAVSDVFVGETEYLNQTIRAYAGETTVHAINGTNTVFTIGDVDDDGLLDCIEDIIIRADPSDGIFELSDVGPDDDFDGDSLPELVEAALGSDSTKAESGLITIFRDGNEIVIRHPEDPQQDNLVITCEASSDPGSPSSWDRAGISRSLLPGNIREWRKPLGAGAEFFRIRVEAAD